MMKIQKLNIVLPVFHEQENIKTTITEIYKYVKTPFSIIIVYDEENDPTIPVVNILKKQFSKVYLQKNIYGKGIVNAIKTGLGKAHSSYVLLMMADLSDNPCDIDKMTALLDKGYDFICASRYTEGGARNGGPKIKGLLSRAGCKSLQFLTGIPTTDATNAFKCFRKDVISKIKIESVGGFELPLELTVKAYIHGFKIGEIPTKWRERKKGISKFRLFQWLPQYLRWYFYAIKNRTTS